MEKRQYKNLVKKHSPKEDVLYNAIIAFITGGVVGIIGEYLVEMYSSCLSISRISYL